MNLSTKAKQNHKHREETCGCQGGQKEGEGWTWRILAPPEREWEGGGSGVDRELGVNRYKLLPLEWISNEILLCSTGNYI